MVKGNVTEKLNTNNHIIGDLVSVLLLVLQYVLNRYHVDAFMKIKSENFCS